MAPEGDKQAEGMPKASGATDGPQGFLRLSEVAGLMCYSLSDPSVEGSKTVPYAVAAGITGINETKVKEQQVAESCMVIICCPSGS